MAVILWEPTLELEARRQFGAFHVQQAHEHGWSPSRLYRLRRAGVIRPALPGVCVFTSAPSSLLQRYMVALLWAGPGSALAKVTSAMVHRLDVRSSSRIQIVTPRHLRSPNAQIQVYRRAPLPKDHVVMSGPLTLTSVERTLFDLASELDPESLDTAIDSGISLRLTILDRLWQFWIDYHECGRDGSAIFRERLERRVPGERPPTNRNERKFLNLMEQARLPRPLCQIPIYDGPRYVARPDFMFPLHRLLVEALSRRFHGSIARRIADDARAAELDALGWRVVRVWWEELDEKPDEVVRRIRRSLSVPSFAPTAI